MTEEQELQAIDQKIDTMTNIIFIIAVPAFFWLAVKAAEWALSGNFLNITP